MNADIRELLIPGWAGVTAPDGGPVSFHDAEIVELCLRDGQRASSIFLKLFSLGMDGTKLVELKVFGISELKLDGWHIQNVLWDINFSKRDEAVVLELEASVGISGEIVAERCEIGSIG